MKKKVINTAVCDAREVTEESLAGLDSITINAAALITGERAKAILDKYPVSLNVASVVEIPEGQDIAVKSVNGQSEIGPGADGSGVFLLVNGMLTIANNSAEAVESYYRILANGRVLMPASYQGRFANLITNGTTAYYPDGAFLLKGNTEVDDLFVARAANTLYYCPGDLLFLDAALDAGKLLDKGIRFAARRLVIARGLLDKLISQFDEESELVVVPDGTRRVEDDLELTPEAVRRHGTKLFVSGDVSIRDAEALEVLEYLFADGVIKINRELEEAFEKVESVYAGLKVLDSTEGLIADRAVVKIGPTTLKKYPGGLRVEDCAKVVISEELSAEDILEDLHIADCAIVTCTKEQEEAVTVIAEDVALIRIGGEDKEGDAANGFAGGMSGALFDNPDDTQMINAADYKL